MVLSGQHTEDSGLGAYLDEYLCAFSMGQGDVSDISMLWNGVSWPLGCLLFCRSPLGVGIIPLIFTVRGFLLTFSSACIACVYGVDGILIAGGIFIVAILFHLPAMFLLGSECFRGSLTCVSDAPTLHDAIRLETILVGVGLLSVSFAFELVVQPRILSSICFYIFN